MDTRVVSLLVALCTATAAGQTITCYSCQNSGGSPPGQECVDSPWNYTLGANQIPCNQSCTVQRRTIIATGALHFISRGCGPPENSCSDQGTMKECRTSCGENYCNHGDGIPEGLTMPPTGNTVPGTTPSVTPSVPPSTSRQCYICSYVDTNTGQGYECLTQPLKQTKMNCPPERHCTTSGVWLRATGRWRSYARGCEVKTAPEGCVWDAEQTSCHTYCTGHLCNSQVRTPPVPPGTGAGHSVFRSHTLSTWLPLSALYLLLYKHAH